MTHPNSKLIRLFVGFVVSERRRDFNLKNTRFGAFRAENIGTVGDEAFAN